MTRAVLPHHIAPLITELTDCIGVSDTAINAAIVYLTALPAAVQTARDLCETAGASDLELTDMDTLITAITADVAPIISDLEDAIP